MGTIGEVAVVRNMVFLNFYFDHHNAHSFFELSLFLILFDLIPPPHSFASFSYCSTIIETQKTRAIDPVSVFIFNPFFNHFYRPTCPTVPTLSLCFPMLPYVSLCLPMQSLQSRRFSLYCRHPHSFPTHPPHNPSQDTKSKIYW